MQGFGIRMWVNSALAGMALVMAGCATSHLPAPLEDRGTMGRKPQADVTDSVKLLPGSENLGKPGYYAVRPGDTIMRIGLDTGQNWRDVARWNNLENPNLIEVGQVLRVVPPTGMLSAGNVGSTANSAPPTSPDSTGVVTRPVTQSTLTPGSGTAAAAAAAAAASASAKPAPTVSLPSASASTGRDEDVGWIWPSPGVLLAGFDEAKNKGLDIGGKAGDSVMAAADGRVVYAGAGLRGYGNLIILKHNNTYLTAYAHNQTLLVKEDQNVQKGQKIAEMGNSDADRVKLHFEIRRQGKPVDPSRYLPAR